MATDVESNNDNFNQNYDEEEEEDSQTQFDQNGDQFDDDNNDGSQRNSLNGSGADSPKFVRLRGLPWSATHQQILDFLKDINVVDGSNGIHLVTSRWDGKSTGEAYVEVQSQQDVDEALKLNKASMGHRYIEVFAASSKDAKDALRKTTGHGNFVVKLRGLPYSVTEQQIEEFFNGLEIKPDREGILFLTDRRGRATGQAFVQFVNQEDTEQALGRNREKIGHRYIEIFRSSLAELKRSASGNSRPGPYDLKDRGGNRGGNDFNGGRNNMRGGDWGNNGGYGASNALGFNNLSNFSNSGNFGNGNGFGGGNRGGGDWGNGGGFGGNNLSNFSNSGNFGNGNGNGFGGGNSNRGFGSDFGDFGNFGNNRGNNFNGGGNNGGMNDFGNNRSNFGNFGNFGNGNNNGGGGGNMGGGFNNFGNGGNFGPIGGGRNENDYFVVHMRGLPYSSYENDVFKFFDPLRPAHVRINFNKKGLHSGTADVLFDTYEDAQIAMKRHRDQMGSRYIELFFDGKSNGKNGSGGGGSGNNNNFSRRI